VSKKAKTEAERRQELEIKAAALRAKDALDRANAEAEEIQRSKTVYENIWAQFAADSKQTGKSAAYANLKANLALSSSYLVPYMMTATEHMKVIASCDEHIKGDGGKPEEDPRQLIAQWLRGEIELSRVPLEEPAPFVEIAGELETVDEPT
jgi:hypothetical protein